MISVMFIRLWTGVSLIIRGSEIVTLESEALSGVQCVTVQAGAGHIWPGVRRGRHGHIV